MSTFSKDWSKRAKRSVLLGLKSKRTPTPTKRPKNEHFQLGKLAYINSHCVHD